MKIRFEKLKEREEFILNHLKWKKVKSPHKWKGPGRVPPIEVETYYNALCCTPGSEGYRIYVAPNRLVKRISTLTGKPVKEHNE